MLPHALTECKYIYVLLLTSIPTYMDRCNISDVTLVLHSRRHKLLCITRACLFLKVLCTFCYCTARYNLHAAIPQQLG